MKPFYTLVAGVFLIGPSSAHAVALAAPEPAGAISHSAPAALLLQPDHALAASLGARSPRPLLLPVSPSTSFRTFSEDDSDDDGTWIGPPPDDDIPDPGAVPEPASAMLGLLGFALAALRRRRG